MMQVGDFAETKRAFSRADVEELYALAGYSGTISSHVPEPLIGALFSYLLGAELPGYGTNYLKQELNFTARAPLDAILTARVEITRLRPEKHLVDLATTCRSADGTLICKGRSLTLAKDTGKGYSSPANF